MAHEIVQVSEGQQITPLTPLSSTAILTRVAQVKQIMAEVMKEDVHYGKIPGCDKPSLYQAGAEKLALTFRLAISFPRADMVMTQTNDMVRADVRCVITDQMTGAFLGDEWGTCSSDEEKYAWRKAWDDEWNATPVEKRREKKGKYRTLQVRTNPADVANTVLAMACKRAKVRAVRAVLGVSDMFEVNVEDLPEELREEYFGDQSTSEQKAKAQQQRQQARGMEQRAHAGASGQRPPQAAPPPQQPAPAGEVISKADLRTIMQMIEEIPGYTTPDPESGRNKWTAECFRFLAELGMPRKVSEMTPEQGRTVIAALAAMLEPAEAPGPDEDMPDVADPFADQG